MEFIKFFDESREAGGGSDDSRIKRRSNLAPFALI